MKDFITRYETMNIDGAEAFYDGAIIGELIRCKDCKHYVDYHCELLDDLYTQPKFFCAWGEKKTE